MSGMTMEQFLGHKTQSRGSVLKDWKDKGRILVWLNRNSGLHCLWRHNFYKRVDLRDKAPDIWGERFNCFERDEQVLANRYRRDKDTGERMFPTSCGYCRFLDDLYRAVKVTRDLDWLDEIFRWQVPGKTVVMHAGGLLGLFKSKDLTDEDKTAMAAVGMYQKEAFKYESRVKPEYLFCVVNDADTKAGIQVAVQPQSLGDKMKIEIGKQIKARGPKGDPTLNPYPFLWEYSAEGSFDDAYTVTPMIEERPSPEVLRLIDGPAPDVSTYTRGHSAKMVRTMLEQACVVDVGGWEQYFPDEPEGSEQRPETKDDGTPPKRTPEVTTRQEPAEEPDDVCACDGCGKPMKVTAAKCPHEGCGKTYEVESIPPKAEPTPPPLKKRSEAKREQQAATSTSTEKSTPAKFETAQQNIPDPTDMFGGGSDDIPF